MTIQEREEFVARWLSVLNSPDAGGRRRRCIIAKAIAKVIEMPAD